MGNWGGVANNSVLILKADQDMGELGSSLLQLRLSCHVRWADTIGGDHFLAVGATPSCPMFPVDIAIAMTMPVRAASRVPSVMWQPMSNADVTGRSRRQLEERETSARLE